MTWDQGQWQPAPQGRPEASAPSPVRSPFGGLGLGDGLRDVLAALLLVVSLTLPWDYAHLANGRLEVVVITLISLASLSLGYLARANAFGTSLTLARAATMRMLANIPYVVMFAVFLFVDAVSGSGRENGGIGAAAALGLAGAFLAAQRRDGEIADRGRPHWLDGVWPAGPLVLAAAYVLTAVTSLVIFLIGRERWFSTGVEIAMIVLTLVLGLVLIVLPLIGLLRRDGSWRLVLIAVAVAPVGLYLIGKEGAAPAPMVESIHSLSPGLIYWPALTVLAAAPAVRRAMRVAPGTWIRAVVHLLTLTIIVAGIDLVVAALALVRTDQTLRRSILVSLGLLYVAVAVVARVMPFLRRPRMRPLVLVMAAALIVVGSIAAAVTAGDPRGWVSPADLLLALAIPLALAVLVVVQMSLDARGLGWAAPTPAPATMAYGAGAMPGPGMPTQAVPGEVPGEVPEEVRLAMDPATPPAILAELAARAPETWVHLARNPATYPDLLAWLAALGRPEVTEALGERTD